MQRAEPCRAGLIPGTGLRRCVHANSIVLWTGSGTRGTRAPARSHSDAACQAHTWSRCRGLNGRGTRKKKVDRLDREDKAIRTISIGGGIVLLRFGRGKENGAGHSGEDLALDVPRSHRPGAARGAGGDGGDPRRTLRRPGERPRGSTAGRSTARQARPGGAASYGEHPRGKGQAGGAGGVSGSRGPISTPQHSRGGVGGRCGAPRLLFRGLAGRVSHDTAPHRRCSRGGSAPPATSK